MPSPFYTTTPRLGLRSLLGTSNVSDVDAGFLALATDVENAVTGYKSGTNAARLAATNIDGLLWRETDTGLLYLGTGTSWVLLKPSGGATNIPASESRTSTSYGTLTTPDQVTGIVLPAKGIIQVRYNATWQESVNGAARAAIFLGANQVQIPIAGGNSPAQTALAAGSANVNAPLVTNPAGLFGNWSGAAYTAPATTGQFIASLAPSASFNPGGPCDIFAAAGVYTVSVQFLASSGSVTVANRQLWVQVLSFA